MASVSGLSGSNGLSSLFNSANTITGLASGMDTESMIENSVLGYKTKIQDLIKQQTKISWKQDAYRSITDKMIALSQKYTSYTSKTNLSSPSFFSSAVKTTTNGKNAEKVSATGKTNSEIKINAVKQLATAARYSVGAPQLGKQEMAQGEAIDLSKPIQTSKISGDLMLTVGREKVTISFAEDEIYANAEELTAAINAKLAEQNLGSDKASERIEAVRNGDSISFMPKGESVSNGDAVWISGVYGDIEDTLGITAGAIGKGDTAIEVPKAGDGKALYEEQTAGEYLSDQYIDVKLGDKKTRVSLGDLSGLEGEALQNKILEQFQNTVDSVFGEGTITASIEDGAFTFKTAEGVDEKLTVSSKAGRALGFGNDGVSNYLTTSATLGQVLGDKLDAMRAIQVGADKVTSTDGTTGIETESGNKVKKFDDGNWYRVDDEGNKVLQDKLDLVVNGKTVGSFDKDSTIEEMLSKINSSDAGVRASYSELTNKFTFIAKETGAKGKIEFSGTLASELFVGEGGVQEYRGSQYVRDDGSIQDSPVLGDANGDPLIAGYMEDGSPYYLVERNGGFVAAYENGNPIRKGGLPPVGGQFIPVDISQNELAAEAVNKARTGFVAGTDAVFSATVNGEEITLSRSTNVIEMDGMSVTLKEAFNNEKDANGQSYFVQDKDGNYSLNKDAKIDAGSVVTFTTKSDADKIVDAVKSLVEEYNAIIKETHSAYTTLPAKRTGSTSKRYEPLTEDEKADLTDDEIEKYEEKAKQGILFGDSELTRLYGSLRGAITPTGSSRGEMTDIGLSTTYEDGVTTLSLNEDKLRAALESDPEAVQKAFTSNRENGDASDGIIARIKKTMDTYASTSIGNYGILVARAGTKTKTLSLTDNTLQKQINNLDQQIDRWTDRMSDKIDYYTKQYSLLEQLMNQMNSQSSALAGLMGG